MKLGALAGLAVLVATPAWADASSAGLVPLPCGAGPLQPATQSYCTQQKHYVTPRAHAALLAMARAFAKAHPGATVLYMEASWPSGVRPMPPHLSHGDGREIDLALFYEDQAGRPLPAPPKSPDRALALGYGAYEPPRHEAERMCAGQKGPHDRADPPASRSWRLDEALTADLLKRLAAEPQVRRVFVEPHLKARLGFGRDAKIRFAGCSAARHDDHIHVDFR